MDIEGAEKVALEGMRELSRRNPKLKLIIEFSPDSLSAAGVSPVELLSTAQSLGFAKLSIISRNLEPLEGPQHIQRLLSTCKRDNSVNLLCERE
jgi:hypothetical protein